MILYNTGKPRRACPVLTGWVASFNQNIRTVPKLIDEDKKISLEDLTPIIIKTLRKHGGRARKEDVEKEIYEKFKQVFNASWYQETVSAGVQRWRYIITLAKEVAKSKGLIKRPEHSKQGYWELSEKVK
jgi:hypothetical protein